MDNLNDIAITIAKELAQAHNEKNISKIESIFYISDKLLEISKINTLNRRNFWISVEENFFKNRLLVENQDNSSLNDLIKIITRQINERK